MKNRTRRPGWLRLAAVGMVLGVIVGCGGGGGGDPAGDTTADEGPQAGADYFPLAVGDRWFYDADGGTVRVTGTQATSSGAALVVHTEDSSGTYDDLYLKTAGSIVVLPAADAFSTAVGPLTLLRLPLAKGAPWTVAEATLPAFADFDDDGRADTISVQAEAIVVGFETVTGPGGRYPSAALVRTTIIQSVTPSGGGGTVSVTLTSDDWYAPDIGNVRNVTRASGDAGESRSESSLLAWVAGGHRSEQVAPSITTQTPAAGATAYGPLTQVQLTFDEVMDTNIAAADILQVMGADGQPVPGTVQWLPDDRSLLFSSSTGLDSGLYRARVRTAAQDRVGNGLATESTWSFTIDASGPAPTPVQPLADATEVPLDTTVIFTLDEDADPTTVIPQTVTLYNQTAGSHVEADVSLAGRTITLTPKAPLVTGARYQVVIQGVADTHGNQTYAATWSFSADPGRFAAPQRLLSNDDVTAVAIGDVDGDGNADALLATGYGFGSADGFTLFVFRGDGQGGFASPRRHTTQAEYGGEIRSMFIADLDGLGRNAVIVGASGVGIEIFRRQPDGTLASSQVITTAASDVVRAADMDGDGRPDLIGRPFTGTAVKVWLQGADGRFDAGIDVPVDVNSFGDMAVGDVDGDGRPDIAIASGNQPWQSLGIVLRTPDGGYASPIYPDLSPFESARGVAIGDVTGDGRADIVLTLLAESRIAVLAQTAQGGLAAPVAVHTGNSASHVMVADIDGDGRDDVVSWSWGGYPVALNRQRDDGTLGGAEQWPVADDGVWASSQMAVGDLDGDGRPDILYASAWLRQRAVPASPPPEPMSAAVRRSALGGMRFGASLPSSAR